ncbi:amidotransferase 1, exosortase A system-associated [Altericroceibacterium spongiae]|uniref:asparagine synthase (glutamine-hydrolyzing) n=1 Tax=Altericroceibacterium spongiae TaxID=2320269 RepID=A0A420ERC4_9SPHN|nr:XrtA/PEP-CTERM system amidotransferase [Altericroceibacterium spongiae]RKF23246.1 amidotransferase 1, exosortase A system-associated [Altericroceibacterium spongiae]
MCGIAGIFHCGTVKPVEPSRVERMCDALAHRGPDGCGVWIGPGVGLGHRRLSIIDLAGSPQPMASADGRAVIVFNGEIYNFRELRKELAVSGAQFRTDGDTEVILAAWQRWGPECLSHLQGMFAFALYDSERRELFLVRDRLGVKPLYIAHLSDGSLAFASEMKGLMAHPLLRRDIDPLAIEDYMTWGYVPDHRAFLKGVEKLPAGHFCLLRHDAPPAAPRSYWDVSFTERSQHGEKELRDELLHIMREAIRSRMVADVPLGAFLSGGVDSSSVVALMAEASTDKVQSCSIGFDVGAVDESLYAHEVAELFHTDHHSRAISADQFSEIGCLASIFDEPFADASALPTLQVCKLARETVTVALSGDGADEAMAGYRRQVFHRHEERLRGVLPAILRKRVLEPLGRIYPKADWAPRPLRAKSTLLALATDGAEAYAAALSTTSVELRNRLYTHGFKRELGGYRAEDPLIRLMQQAPARTGLDRAQYADLKFWLPGDILTKTDRTSMAVGLEAREPLLDHRLIEFSARLPDRMRVNGRQGKWLMKQTMRAYLPDKILFRPKQGFVTPIAQWMRGPLVDEVRAISKNAHIAQAGWFESRELASLAEDHISGRSDHSRLLWQLLMLEKSLTRLAS